MNKYHAIVIKESLENPNMISDFNVIGQRNGDWTTYKIEFAETDLERTIIGLRSLLETANPWYIHAYNESGKQLVVIFKKVIFNISSDKSGWEEVIRYGLSLGIPREQLDFYPHNFQSEEF